MFLECVLLLLLMRCADVVELVCRALSLTVRLLLEDDERK